MPYADPIKQKEATHRSYIRNKKKVYRKASLAKKQKLEYVNNYKNKPCADCGKKYPPAVMDLHHLDKDLKDDNIAKMIHSAGWERLIKELKKCIVICSNCHRIREYCKIGT